jgi:hypothetical protein
VGRAPDGRAGDGRRPRRRSTFPSGRRVPDTIVVASELDGEHEQRVLRDLGPAPPATS